MKSLGDGNAKIDAIVSAEAGEVFDQPLKELAKSVCPQDARTMDQRRDDALVALTEGRALPCTSGGADGRARANAEQPRPSRIVINVIADRATVLGTGAAPAYLSGYGVIDADHVRELAERATLRLVDEPEVSRADAMRYQPSAALERWIRCRDLTCRFPGCGPPAEVRDIDHTVPFNHANPESGGLTVSWNLKCRHHHRTKTSSPAGTTGNWPTVRSSGHRRPDTPTAPRRAAPTCSRGSAKQPAGPCKFFEGNQPSISPFCAWINDPMEPEELTPDWRPPPAPLQVPTIHRSETSAAIPASRCRG